MHRVVAAQPGMIAVPDLFAIVVGASSLIVDGDVTFADELTVPDVEQAIMRAAEALRARWPSVDYVYLTPVPKARSRRAARAARATIHGSRPAPPVQPVGVPSMTDSHDDPTHGGQIAETDGVSRVRAEPERTGGTSPHQESIVNEAHARDNVARERARIEALLTGLDGDIRAAGSLRGQQTGELEEGASGLEAESVDVALAANLRAELAAVGRAEERIADGSPVGRSRAGCRFRMSDSKWNRLRSEPSRSSASMRPPAFGSRTAASPRSRGPGVAEIRALR